VPSDASAARGGRETVPLVECALTVANASIASEVRRLARMEEEGASGGTVKLLARLRGPIGEGGSVVSLRLGLCVVGLEDRPAVYAPKESLPDGREI
jgi:hypothetical protein